MTNINYSYLFTIELLHKYFNDGLCNDFTLTPSALTKTTLAGNKILAKQNGNKYFTGLQVDNDGKPLAKLSADLQLTFFMQLNNALFFNYTNLPFSNPPGKIYYFSNRVNNAGNSKNFLTQPVTYSSTQQYHPGDIAADNTGLIFQCISSCKNIAPASNANWLKVDNNRYVSEADALQWLPGISNFIFDAPQSNAVVEAFTYNPADKKFSTKVFSKTTTFNKPTKNFQLDISKLAAGKYRLTVNGAEQLIYVNDELSFKPVFAIIEIFNDSSIANSYKLLNGNEKPPVYSIDFLNRATIWKYILNNTSKGKISISPAGFNFPAAANNTIISLSPIPLSEKPLNVTLALSTINSNPANVTVTDVACASPQRLTSFIKGADTYACSEIHLNL